MSGGAGELPGFDAIFGLTYCLQPRHLRSQISALMIQIITSSIAAEPAVLSSERRLSAFHPNATKTKHFNR